MSAVVAYGVRLTDWTQHDLADDLLEVAEEGGPWAVYGQVDSTTRNLFIITYLVSCVPGDVICFEPVSPRRHLWDAAIENITASRGLAATEPGWMIFFQPNS